MRGVADFNPDYPGSYFLPATVTPPTSLLGSVWPGLDRWMNAHFECSEGSAPEDVRLEC